MDSLAERFEVSPRTIKREQIVSLDGRGGGYQLSQHAALSAVTFTAAEANAVAIALAGDPQLPSGVDGEAALQTVVRAMIPPQCVETDDMASSVWMRRPPDDAQPIRLPK